MQNVQQIRNIVILGHGNSGKTTISFSICRFRNVKLDML